ncbi:aspartate aminotransferase family protein [Oceanobacillus luteolus]|uniref:Aspartate aminotransferase family protein n=1 Tax=Oceanobacillus luteolus TaxID=1274358 RepID=A0ABW4HMY5_9BACI
MEQTLSNKAELIELDKKHFLHPTSSIQAQQKTGAPLVFTEGNGIYLKDMEGDMYIDGMSSLWNVNIGHGRKELAEVAAEQMNKLAFSSTFSGFSHEPAIRLAKKLADLAPGNLNVSFFTSGGSEANDSAIKLVRHYWKVKGFPERKKVITRKRGYHGVSMGSTSATGIPEFHAMTTSLAPDFLYAPTPYIVEGEFTEEDLMKAAQEVRKMIESEGPETIAAFMAEPIQGAGGIIVPPEKYFEEIRNICDEYGVLFIADEVITGFGRTGKMFGLEHWDVVPDVMTIAKGISSGYVPLGAVMINDEIHRELIKYSKGTLFHGFTYSGHPVGCAVALKNIELIEEERLIENAAEMGQELEKGLKYLEEKHWSVGRVRNVGLLGAFELLADRDKNTRFDATQGVAGKVVQECLKRNLIVRSVTYEGTDIIAIAPPLSITKEEIKDIISIFDDAVSAVETTLK